MSGLARSYIAARLSEPDRSVFLAIDQSLDFGLDWRWVNGREVLTLAGLRKAVDELQQRGCPDAAAIISGELAKLQCELAAAAPAPTVRGGKQSEFWWEREGDE